MKFHLGYLLGLSAIIVAACAAFFSVFGLSQLFAGASMAVIVMATALEVSKIIAASFLHSYWGEMSKVLRIYLTVGVVVLVTITSAGIYGFLTNAYQKTANSLMVHEGEVGLLDGKIAIFKNKIENNQGLIDSKSKRVSQLSELRASQEERLDDAVKRKYYINAANTRKEIAQANEEIQKLQGEVDLVSADNNKLNDSISVYEMKKLTMVSTSEVAAEVGPLKYLAELTGKPMDVIVNYFVLLLVFVFDPMAISLVIATGWVFRKEKNKLEDKKRLQGEYLKAQWDGNYTSPYEVDHENDEQADKETEKGFSDDELTDEAIEAGRKSFADAVERIIEESEPKSLEEVEQEIEKIQEETNEESVSDLQKNMAKALESIKVEPKPKIPLKEEDIPEVKNRQRKFSVEVPKSNNSVERIGSNKFRENDNTVVYRNKRNDR